MSSIRRSRKAIITLMVIIAFVVGSAFNVIDLVNVGSAVPVSQFVNFESAHVHPLDMTPDGTKLLAVNTANNSLEIFQITANALVNTASIPVGVDPVTVRVRSNTEAWVVNQVSDDISIVDLTLKTVVRTLTTQDEPADVVFAGAAVPTKAFVSCAGRESVQVFGLADLSAAPTEVLLNGEQPRALAVSNNKLTVYCAFFESGNATTVLNGNDFFSFQHGTFAGGAPRKGICSPQGGCTVIPNDVTNTGGPYGGAVSAAAGIVPNAGTGFNPPLNAGNPPTPESKSLIVRKNAAGQWMDDNGGNWTAMVSGNVAGKARMNGWDMPDRDVAVIDAVSPTTTPVAYQTRLGNILMNMAVNPATGQVNVIGTDATNEVRFEPNLNGRFLRVNLSRFTTVGGATTITDMNDHLTYTAPSVAPALRVKSIGDPRGMVFTANGAKVYVTGMGSNNVIVLNSDGTRNVPDPIPVGEGPTGIVLNGAETRAYVLNKFEGTISTIDLTTNKEVARANYFDPTPLVIKAGRKHLYNTHLGSGTGHIACGSCHVDGRWDRLGWDLGNPAGDMETVDGKTFHPLKGVKTTQFLIDIIGRGRGNLHWRGDKHGFEDFAGAFQNLQGLSAPKPLNEMQEFKDFLAASWYVPNPYRVFRPQTDGSNSRMNAIGVRATGTTFQTVPPAVNLFVSVQVNCSHCHNAQTGRGDLAGDGNVAGTGAGSLVDFTPNRNMGADLRSTYRKNGFFYNTTECNVGFGMMSEGVMETWFNGAGVANYLGDYETELLSWSGGIDASNSPQSFGFPLANAVVQDAMPGVGMQQTVHGAGVGSTTQVDWLKQLAVDKPAEYGLIVKGLYGSPTPEPRGFYYVSGNNYQSDITGQTVTHAQLVAAAQTGTQPLTWTLVQPTTTVRLGVDRDADGILDHDDQQVQFAAAAALEGPLNGTVMRHDLADASLLPAFDPGGSGAQAAPQVLAYTGNSAPVDWMKVELRNAANNTQVVASIPALLQASGNLIMPTGEQTLRFPTTAPGNYYVVVKHRNHLGVMSSAPITLTGMGTLVDFTSSATPTWGTSARKTVGSVMVLYAGDVNGDGTIRYTNAPNDRDPILSKIGGVVPTATVPGYWPEDVNLDGVVKYTNTANDREPILTNIGGVVPTNTRVQQVP